MILTPTRMSNPNGPAPAREVVNEAVRETSETEVDVIATYTATSFDLFHIGAAYRDAFEDEAGLKTRLESLAQDARSEFVERDLFSGMRPMYDRIEYRSEVVESRKRLQIFCGGVGMFLIVDADEAVEPLVEQAARLLGNQV